MRRVYVVLGELEDINEIDTIEGVYPSMEAAENRCSELEADSRAEHDGHIWYWRETTMEDEVG